MRMTRRGMILDEKEKVFDRGFLEEHRSWSGTFAGNS